MRLSNPRGHEQERTPQQPTIHILLIKQRTTAEAGGSVNRSCKAMTGTEDHPASQPTVPQMPWEDKDLPGEDEYRKMSKDQEEPVTHRAGNNSLSLKTT